MVDLFRDIGFGHDLALAIARSLGVFVVVTFALVWTLLGIWIERKVAARIQNRPGPNRVGPFGLIQTVADTVKIILKEDIIPRGADRWLFNIAPVLAVFAVVLVWAVVPFNPAWIGTDLSIAVLYLVAVGSFGTVAVLMAGWSSNNKFALLSTFRAVAQLISYEVPLVLSLLVPVLLTGSLSLQGIIEGQHIWYAFALPVTWVIFLISSQAENGRAPFDLLEAESELVSGFHIEYSGMKFGLFYVGEFLHSFTIAVLFSILFLGGWRGPFVWDVPVLGFVYLMIKSVTVYVALTWIRLTLPRLRIDQMLDFNWKFLVPLSLINLLAVALVWKIVPDTDAIDGFADALGPMLALLAVNLVIIAGVGLYLREMGRRDRLHIEGRPTVANAVDSTRDPAAAPAPTGD